MLYFRYQRLYNFNKLKSFSYRQNITVEREKKSCWLLFKERRDIDETEIRNWEAIPMLQRYIS